MFPWKSLFSEEAQALFADWRRALEERLLAHSMPDHKKSYLSKYRSLLPSLALIFQTVEAVDFAQVSLAALQKAIKWSLLLESHVDKILGLSISSKSHAKALLNSIREGTIYSGMKVRELYRRKPQGIKSPKGVKEGLKALEKNGYIKIIKEKTQGAPSETIFINPAFEGDDL